MHRTAALAALLCAGVAAAGPVHHRLTVRLDAEAHALRATDALTVPGPPAPVELELHDGLALRVLSPGWRLERLAEAADSGAAPAGVPVVRYRLVPGRDAAWPADLAWSGEIRHPLRTQGAEYQRSFAETPGLIAPDGVYLAGATRWLPTVPGAPVTFELTVEGLEPPWDVVSQGERTRHESAARRRTVTWSCPLPQEEVYLVAGPWHEYDDRAGRVTLRVFLRSEDADLARRYLDAVRRYLRMYQEILPPYPYPAFAVVENFWETGYGMPGFTLLGPRILRMPWILTSSLPHELLHDWWGNGVYVDLDRGNWCEGLTAYMADHLLAEQRGEGARYRRDALKKYADFVRSGRDLPLSRFTARHSPATEAVGYGKSLMLFHMVRRALGDRAFLDALGRFFAAHRFRRASWDDLAAAFSEVSGRDWRPFFRTWVERAGAPRVTVTDAGVDEPEGPEEEWRVTVHLEQRGDGPPWPLALPVAVTYLGEGSRPVTALAEARWDGGSPETEVTVRVPGRPVRLDVDPRFDAMRRLDPREVPPALSTAFGAGEPLFVLPAAAAEAELAAWRKLAAAWAAPGTPRTVLDRDLDELPPDGACWVLGWSNWFARTVLERLADQDVGGTSGKMYLPTGEIPTRGHSVAVVASSPDEPDRAWAWVAADPPEAIAGLARKLPHYTRYGYVAFEGPEPRNVLKGTWRAVGSPLLRPLAEGPLPEPNLPAERPLVELPPAFDPERLAATVRWLAGPELEGRGLGTEGLARATAWVEARMREAGLEPGGSDGFRQRFRWTGGDPPRELALVNLVGKVPGSEPALRPLLVTAHLDHLGRGWPDVRSGNEGKVHPGADDNASGVAALLELAQAVASGPRPLRTVLFAVTTGEEAGLVGARHLLASLEPGGLPYACVNLDTVGRLADTGKLYVLDAASAREWPHVFRGAGYTTGAPVAVVPERLDASDQVACLERGIPAVQLTTGPTPDYHRPSDTAEKIDARGLATVAEVAHEAVSYLAARREPLHAAEAGGGERVRGGREAGGERPFLGTVPDFAFAGPGVRVASVVPGSPAEAAGIHAGDVLVALGGERVEDLRAYAAALRRHRPGERVAVTVRRDGAEVRLEAVLARR